MKIDADPHNFGQHVIQVDRASEMYFQKPRPIYWEWFFFGKKSPISSIFEEHSSKLRNISEILFNLEVHFEKGDCGISKQIIEMEQISNQSSHAYNLGLLSAYCYIFGIRDLHKGNVIRKETYLQVIDAEVVFSRLLLPNETLLLPFKENIAAMCGAQKIFGDNVVIDLESLKRVLAGYFDLFAVVLENRDQLIEIFEDHREKMRTVPIRHIMRDTAFYRKWKDAKQVSPIAFCSDESIQLERGDIPYYFKFIGDPNLYAYTNPDGAFEAITAPIEFQKGINRDATDPIELLAVLRLNDDLLPTGSLFLLKKLLPYGFTGTIDGGNFSANVASNSLQICFSGRTFAAKL